MISRRQIEHAEARLAAAVNNRTDTEERLRRNEVLVEDSVERRTKRVERIVADREVAAVASQGIVEAAAEVPAAALALERVLGTNDLMSVSYLERGLMAARTVGRVHIRTKRAGRLEGYGTGFLVGKQLLLTNNHVIPNRECGSFSQIEFGYEDLLAAGEPSFFLDLEPEVFFATDEALDFTLLAVRDPGGRLEALSWNPLIAAEGKITTNEYVSIIQHPEGQPKQVALRENRLVGILEQHIIYHTDTAPGSSGSPVYNDQWEVIGLHHSGVPRKDAQGNWLTRDGQIWKSALGEQQIDWIANEGVRISRIVRNVSEVQALSDAQRRLWVEALERAPDRAMPWRQAGPERAGSAPVGNGQVDADGRVTWILPLEISIRVGAPSPPGYSREADQRLSTGGLDGDRSRPTLPGSLGATPSLSLAFPGTPAADGEEVKQALAQLAEAKTKPYYDRTADEKAKQSYYTGLDLGNDPAANYALLSRLVRQTHRDQPRYKPMLEVYPWVDLQPDYMLKSVYSGKTYDPATFIQEDFRIEAERAGFAERMRLAESAGAAGAARVLEALEAALPYNCEHVVPQSWFAKEEPMRGDLHHLFACESGCNSFRGNIPYFDFSDADEAKRDACGRREQNRFEPGAGKGAVARATLYFLLRYPGEINDLGAEYEADRLATLVAWSLADGVSEHERHRNAAIYERQGNRNPFIDSPAWVEHVAFERGLG